MNERWLSNFTTKANWSACSIGFLYYLDNTHTQSEMYALWAKKATFSCDYLLANSILLKGVLFQIIDSQESDRWLSPSHHLPSGQVAYFYYNTWK